MPRRQPTISYQELRAHLEKFSWRDPRTGVLVTGFNPPEKAQQVRRKEVYVKYLTMTGKVECGVVECIKVFPSHQRLVRFTASGEIRRISDILVMEVDGIRVISE